MAPRAVPWPEMGDWAVRPAASGATGPDSTAGATAGDSSVGAPSARTFGSGAAGAVTPRKPLAKRPGLLQLSFLPPGERTVGVNVVGELTIISQAECEVTVRVDTRRGLRIANARDGVLYQGPVRRGEKLQVPVKLIATKPGTQRLRLRLEADVPLGEGDLDILVPGFTGHMTRVGETAITLKFTDTPVATAIRQMAAAAGARVVIDEDVEDVKVTQDYSAGVPFAAALRILCETAGCQVQERDGVYHIVR